MVFSFNTFTVYSQYTQIFNVRMIQEHVCKAIISLIKGTTIITKLQLAIVCLSAAISFNSDQSLHTKHYIN